MLVTTIKEQKKAAGGYDRLKTASQSGKGNVTVRTSATDRFVTLKK